MSSEEIRAGLTSMGRNSPLYHVLAGCDSLYGVVWEAYWHQGCQFSDFSLSLDLALCKCHPWHTFWDFHRKSTFHMILCYSKIFRKILWIISDFFIEPDLHPCGIMQTFHIYFSPFSTGLAQTCSAGLPLRSCWAIGALLCRGTSQCPFFVFMAALRFKPPTSWLPGGCFTIRLRYTNIQGHIDDYRNGSSRNIANYWNWSYNWCEVLWVWSITVAGDRGFQPCGSPEDGLLPLRHKRPQVSPAGRKRWLKGVTASYFENGSGCCKPQNITGRPDVSTMWIG